MIQDRKATPANSRYISTTDPDAAVTRHGNEKSKLRYKTHRAMDSKHEVITATKITPGAIDDVNVLKEMIEAHEQNTENKVDTAVGDSKYGTSDNFLLLYDSGIKVHAIFISLFRSTELQGLNPVEKILADAKILLGATQKEQFTFKLAA